MGLVQRLLGRKDDGDRVRSTPRPVSQPGAAAGLADPKGPRGSTRPVEAPAGLPDGLPPLVSLGSTSSGREVLAMQVPSGDLVDWWHRLRDLHPQTGLWPVLLGHEVGTLCAGLPGGMRRSYDDAAELRRSMTLTRADLLEVRATRAAEVDARLGDGELEYGADEDSRVPEQLDALPPAFQTAGRDGWLALVPAEQGWQVPAVLGWLGGVNYGMEPMDHVATLHDWADRFGVEPVAMTNGQVLELLVHRPPTDPAEALEVAKEQFEYCIDIVDQDEDDLTVLAQQQVGSSSWYFWWD